MSGINVDFSQIQGVLSEEQKNSIVRAIEFFEHSDYQTALKILLAISENLNNALVFTCISNCYMKLGDVDNSKLYLEKAVENPSLSPLPYISLGNLYYAEGNLQKSILYWTIANTLTADDAILLLNLATAYAQKDLRIQSIMYYEKFLKFSKEKTTSDYEKVYEKISKLRSVASNANKEATKNYKIKSYDKAIDSYLTSVSNYPLQPQTNVLLGNMLFLSNDFKLAANCWLNAYIASDYDEANLSYLPLAYEKLNMNSYAYCFYYILLTYRGKKAFNQEIIKSKLLQHTKTLFDGTKDYSQLHYNNGKKFELENNYLMAHLEYRNALILAKRDKKKIETSLSKMYDLANPESRVIINLQSQVNKYLNDNNPESAIHICDKILLLAKQNSTVESSVKRKKEECIRLSDSLKK